MKYAHPAIAELTEQLRRGPVRLRLRQLLGIEFLLSLVRMDKQYPLDFVIHALTGYRPQGENKQRESRLLDGEALIADLVLLAEDLSESADLASDALGEPVSSAAELARRFDVSTKTILRWRRRGLTGWKFRAADRRLRVLFPERCVQRFVAQNLELVNRGSSFSQLTRVEREAIIARARDLVVSGCKTVNAVARVISGEQGRAVETIRLILRSYDEAHPRAGLFNRSKLAVAVDDHRLAIWEAHVEGASVAALAARFRQPIPAIYTAITQMRARELLARKIEYIDSPEFHAPDAEPLLRARVAAVPRGPAASPRQVPAELPPYLRQLYQVPLLERDGEVALFGAMNFLKFKADRLRQELDPETATAAELDEIERLLAESAGYKNRLVQANLRLVVSIAKKHVAPGQDLFELISDGNISLMRAVDKFDYTRGFKFSTYASWAIMKNFARSIPEQRAQRERYQTGREDFFETVAGGQPLEHEDVHLAGLRQALERMLNALEPREQAIIRQRFGLEDVAEPQTLEQIGRQLGVSKERIRQLEARAMERLRSEFGADVQKLLGA